jgi:hypothetical protein
MTGYKRWDFLLSPEVRKVYMRLMRAEMKQDRDAEKAAGKAKKKEIAVVQVHPNEPGPSPAQQSRDSIA